MLLQNIKTLFTGKRWQHNVDLEIQDGHISKILPTSDHTSPSIDLVLPAFIDCHTHLIFAGSRAHEFELRSRGATYAEIMQAGGGIQNTVKATRNASEQELIDLAMPRLEHMRQQNIACIEIKSGYGLSIDSELKMLEVIAKLRRLNPSKSKPLS